MLQRNRNFSNSFTVFVTYFIRITCKNPLIFNLNTRYSALAKNIVFHVWLKHLKNRFTSRFRFIVVFTYCIVTMFSFLLFFLWHSKNVNRFIWKQYYAFTRIIGMNKITFQFGRGLSLRVVSSYYENHDVMISLIKRYANIVRKTIKLVAVQSTQLSVVEFYS